ncbi:outer membrane beta-barrel protein [Paraflavisolibacter sp. H34]|uniref:outer membrane beta-barrel protein n=1 Tax=Huijunlia imazamoxiresistens TaxID=3127457 RepID=UPI00301AD33C
MRKFFAFCVLFLLCTASFAQQPGGNRGGRAGGQMPQGRLYGKVVDASNKGIEAVSVTLVRKQMDSVTKQTKDAVVGGMLTTSKGDFSVENVPVMGRYFLKISGIGYKTYEQPVGFQLPNRNGGGDPGALMGALDKDLGNIKLEIDGKLLGNVTVTASKPSMTMGIDRKVFNVEQNLVSAGGSAVDVLKNVPSVAVDIDGNVSLRNSSPTVFVDGRPTNLTLDQIPSDAIESIEVITNPSAKYDASGGTAGILNIVLKKNKRVGYSGNLRTNLDSRGRVGGGINLNVRQNKVNFFAMGNYNQRKSKGSGTTDRTTIFNDTTTKINQQDRSTMTGGFGFGRAGFDYFIDNRNTLTISGSMMRGEMKPENSSDIYTDAFKTFSTKDDSLLWQQTDNRLTNGHNIFRNMGAQAGFKHNFPKTGHEWTADLTYQKGKNENNSLIRTLTNNTNGKNGLSSLQQEGAGDNDNIIVQTDYTNPLTENAKLEMGARASVRTVNSATNYFNVDQAGNRFPRANQNIDYNSRDRVYAAYANFANRIKNFGYQLGLRAESSNYEGEVVSRKSEFKIDFPLSLFPSLFLSQKLNESGDEMQFNYSRRINRPGFWQLFPFYDLTDSLNISRGNEALRPEFTNSFELSYAKTFKNRDNLLASLYFKNTTDLITRIQTKEFVEAIDTSAYVLTYTNANSSYVTGLELTSRNKVTKWWEVTTNANFFTSKIDLEEEQDPDQFLSYFVRLNNNIKLPKNFSVQLSGNYNSKRQVVGGSNFGGGGGGRMGGGGFGGGSSARGFIRPQYDVDAALRFDFLKEKAASITLSVNDLFKTRKFDSFSEGIGFTQNSLRIRDQQIFRLNFNWRFGKFDASLFKRKNNKADNGDGGMEGAGF